MKTAQVWDSKTQKYIDCKIVRQIPHGAFPNIEIKVNGQKRIVGFGSLRNFYTNPN